MRIRVRSGGLVRVRVSSGGLPLIDGDLSAASGEVDTLMELVIALESPLTRSLMSILSMLPDSWALGSTVGLEIRSDCRSTSGVLSIMNAN